MDNNSDSSKEPIAIVGIGCRFPGGANSPKAFWNLLKKGKDAIVDVPKDRWDLRKFYDPDPDKPGKMYVKQGGFLKEKIDHFDPLFFGISPREAESMDPQQRLLLEVSWEAFEDAGITADQLSGSQTGVFIGGFCMDSMLMRFGQLNREIANSHSAASSTMTILSNRISYIFDLKGPSLTMDTACSSSLVATHYACQSLWNGESNAAIAGGVNVMLRPEFPIVMCKGKFLSPHARCKAFDEDAAGYARGEGAGVVVLKTLSAAKKNNDRIYALIRGTGVNQDGHTDGITLPSSESQERLVRDVYSKSGIKGGEVSFVEAHGTGTQAGDPAEIKALNNALSEDRSPENKCRVGTVKTNIGHLEAAAGIAGVIKTALSLHHEKILPNLHFKKPNPKIPFEKTCIQIPTTIQDWNRNGAPRYAGVNSFGYGGTNAHALLQEAPLAENQSGNQGQTVNRPYLLPLSARSEDALRTLASKHAFFLTSRSDPEQFQDYLYTLTHRRSHHPHRLALVSPSIEDLRLDLQKFSAGETAESATYHAAEPSAQHSLAFVFTGMGPQWWGMGRELMKKEPVFRKAVEECDDAFRGVADWSILDELAKDEAASRMAKTEIAQPANFVIQVGLHALWLSFGVEPSVVIGHSVGEVASTYISGALSLEDAIKVSYHRSRLQQTLSGNGAMLAAGLAEVDAEERISGFPNISVAAINSPNSVTLSGDSTEIEALAAKLENEGLFNRKLKVEVAYHSSQMDPIKDELFQALATIRPIAAKIPLVSTVTGQEINGEQLTASYWWQNVRQPVRFHQGIQNILEAGHQHFLEIGPHPVLGHSVKEIAASRGTEVKTIQSLNRKQPEQRTFVDSIGKIFTHGHAIEWETLTTRQGSLVNPPSYPWQKEKYWIETQESRQDRLGRANNVFLNSRLTSPQPTWTVELNEQFFPFLKDHIVNDQTVFPGACYVEAGLAVANELFESKQIVLTDLVFHNMLILDKDRTQSLCTVYDDESNRFTLSSKENEEGTDWTLNASGVICNRQESNRVDVVSLEELKNRISNSYEKDELYDMLARRGLEYGASFQRAEEIYISDREILIQIGSGGKSKSADSESFIPPQILDTAFHSILAIVGGHAPYVPVSAAMISLESNLPHSDLWLHGTLIDKRRKSFTADFNIIDNQGKVLVAIKEVQMKALHRASQQIDPYIQSLFYAHEWSEYNFDSTFKAPSNLKSFIYPGTDSFDRHLEDHLVEIGVDTEVLCDEEHNLESESITAPIKEDKAEDYSKVFDTVPSKSKIHIFYNLPLSCKQDGFDFQEMANQCMRLTRVVQAIGKYPDFNFTITVATRGTQMPDEYVDFHGLNTNLLWGLGATIENEYANITCQFIDLDPDPNAKIDIALFLKAVSTEIRDLALRAGKAFKRNLKKHRIEERRASTRMIEAKSDNIRLTFEPTSSAQADRTIYSEEEKRAPSKNEIEVQVSSLCRFPTEHIQESTLIQQYITSGAEVEITGTVTAVGRDVEHLTIGDQVIALATEPHISNSVTLPSNRATKLSTENPPLNPFVYNDHIRANYAINHLARIKSGENLLITESAGQLVMAAIQIASLSGACVFILKDAKSQPISEQAQPIRYVSWNDDIESLTMGRGFDVMLTQSIDQDIENALPHLSQNARVIDTGSTEKGRKISIPLDKFSRSLTLLSANMDKLKHESLKTQQRLVEEAYAAIEKETFTPSSFEFTPASKIVDDATVNANQRLIVDFEDEVLEAENSGPQYGPQQFEGSFIITGGNNGFGLEVARWLAKLGAEKIGLVSRSGLKSDEAISAVEEIRSSGITVVSERVDITNKSQLSEFIGRFSSDGPPLKGIVHGAAIIEDSFIEHLNMEKYLKVLAPKVVGALNLFELIKDLELDHFILFSSISSLIGNRGQSSYIAANSFLDFFAHFANHHAKHKTTTINWGALADTGAVARNKKIGELLSQEGIEGLSNETALKALRLAVNSKSNQIGIFEINWEKWGKANPRAAKTSRFEGLSSVENEKSKAAALTLFLSEMDEPSRSVHVEDMVKKTLESVLKIPSDKIYSEQSLHELGIDSLLLIELALTIQSEFGVNIPAPELPRYPTIAALTKNIIARLFQEQQQSVA